LEFREAGSSIAADMSLERNRLAAVIAREAFFVSN
jgi:hypothetical protein